MKQEVKEGSRKRVGWSAAFPDWDEARFLLVAALIWVGSLVGRYPWGLWAAVVVGAVMVAGAWEGRGFGYANRIRETTSLTVADSGSGAIRAGGGGAASLMVLRIPSPALPGGQPGRRAIGGALHRFGGRRSGDRVATVGWAIRLGRQRGAGRGRFSVALSPTGVSGIDCGRRGGAGGLALFDPAFSDAGDRSHRPGSRADVS